MLCPYCGKENPENSKLCVYCGGSLEVPAEKDITEAPTHESPGKVIQPSDLAQVSRSEPAQHAVRAPGGIYGNKIWWFVGCFVLVCLILGCAAVVLGLSRYRDIMVFLQPPTLTSTLPPPSAATPTPGVILSPSPNITPLPVLTNTPNPTLSTSGLLFFDDFSDPDSGWDRIDGGDFYADYFNNTYRIIVYTDMSDSWANPGDNVFDDIGIEVDATKNGGPDDNDFGVICRYQGIDQYYYAVISSDGYYGIIKVTSESSQTLGRDELDYSDSINQGFVTNHIRFDCVGDVLTLYVNGQQIDQQSDSEFTSGNVGLLAGTYDIPGTDILFDNFSVFQP